MSLEETNTSRICKPHADSVLDGRLRSPVLQGKSANNQASVPSNMNSWLSNHCTALLGFLDEFMDQKFKKKKNAHHQT